MTSRDESTTHAKPKFLLLGGHAAIDFANTLVPKPGLGLEFFTQWLDVVAWLKATDLHLPLVRQGLHSEDVAAKDEALALDLVRNFRALWRHTLDELMAGRDAPDLFVAKVNEILQSDWTSDVLTHAGWRRFSMERTAPHVRGESLVLTLLARLTGTFLENAEFRHLRRCANEESCTLLFYDTTKNHRRQWCSNALCGNRHKVAEFRRRNQRSGSPN